MNDAAVAIAAAQAGAAIVGAGFGQPHTVEFKGTVDPVTEIDHRAEEAILAILRAERPDDAVLAEERGGSRDLSGRHWIVDPLDGTVNFHHGIPQVAVAVALYEDGQPRVGVVVDPLREETFVAETGSGAWLNGEPIAVSTRPLSEGVIATGFPYDRREQGSRYAAIVGAVLEEVRGIRRLGSAALDLVWVACGRLDGYWEFGLAPWDIAAAMVVVLEAGGVVTDHTGVPSTVLDSLYVAGGPALQPELRTVVGAHLPVGWPENR
ncbi:MAG: inositol monophosphatase [Acidimicrobiia bacterium]|nr:inositol monophosphatase [Acidimicrobiia bacterium]